MKTTEETIDPAESLDMRGKRCPLPVLRAKVALNRIAEGEVLHVTATDPHAVVDFRAFCARSGHQLVKENRDRDDVLHFFIRRTAGARA